MADPGEPPPNSGEVLQASEYPAPSHESVAARYEAVQLKERERETELEEPFFVAEREASQTAYANITIAEAEELLRSTFAETLSSLNAQPARLLSDAKLDENLGHGSALITADGSTGILEAGLPIETANAEGEMEKVDIGLKPSATAFEPENPLFESAKIPKNGAALSNEEIALQPRAYEP
jgi:hypothetical protein